MKNALDILEQRGFLYQFTDYDVLKQHLAANNVIFYVGFDPTADSLHIGHLLPIMAMRIMQNCGHCPIALVGGATGMIGDPSGKSEARPALTPEEVDRNAESLKGQLQRFLDFSEGRARLVNNADWLASLNYIDFLRETGRHFSVNRMLAMESVKMRLESGGLSFLEFNYMLLQAYDFSVLNERYGCTLQLGGQDQWGNIVAGIDLTRRRNRREVYGATFPLLLKADGEKFGKSSSGAVWLDANRTSPYEYYQFWRNIEDSDVARLLAMFTMLPMDEIKRLAALPPPAINRAKEILGYETTRLAHGEEEAKKTFLAAGAEFGFADPQNSIPTSSDICRIKQQGVRDDLPAYSVAKSELQAGVWIVKLLVDSGLCQSNGEARRLIRGGGCYIDEERAADEKRQITIADMGKGELLLRAGKKKLCRVVPTGD